ncbi:hypothetical protein GS429_17900 [Natronorubrum sp. JWXQ-INN-674]|uniref:Halobacterial output domain-containing protein n=1 Tax=Natronorubrum halalkaliphilum TaxID=2691917 RepID=A0A6B0VTN4_9EURY|nr:HalOD1 output domain-containing protein [Natronorubrum halalkaliphilum]MXV63899.1 hypothetical protein [Natronorubrum halalkaliphilum]
MVSASPSEADASSSLVTAIVEAVADREDVAPTELQPPLYDVIDPDALTALFTAAGSRDSRRVSFTYCGHAVVVDGDGCVFVDDDGERQEPATGERTVR